MALSCTMRSITAGVSSYIFHFSIRSPKIHPTMNIGKSREELARDYGVSRPTFYKMLKRAGIELPARVALSPAELALVYEKLGPPPPPDPLRRKNSTFAIRGGG
jgi:hypothetical protein